MDLFDGIWRCSYSKTLLMWRYWFFHVYLLAFATCPAFWRQSGHCHSLSTLRTWRLYTVLYPFLHICTATCDLASHLSGSRTWASCQLFGRQGDHLNMSIKSRERVTPISKTSGEKTFQIIRTDTTQHLRTCQTICENACPITCKKKSNVFLQTISENVWEKTSDISECVWCNWATCPKTSEETTYNNIWETAWDIFLRFQVNH